VWRPYLSDTVFLCVFRDPAYVISSTSKLLETEGYLANLRMTTDMLNESWGLMYRHILEKHRREGDWMFVHYHQFFDPAMLQRLEDFVAAPVSRSFAERGLERSPPNALVSEANQEIYHALCDAAGYDPAAALPRQAVRS
jgi:hypothetical protein